MKASEMREKSETDLFLRERDLNDQLFKLRFYRATGAVESSHKLREIRREIARIKTVLRQKKDA